jgi:hypothetical protein
MIGELMGTSRQRLIFPLDSPEFDNFGVGDSLMRILTFIGPCIMIYRVSINSFPDYNHLLQENYVEYKHIFFKCNSIQEVFFAAH